MRKITALMLVLLLFAPVAAAEEDAPVKQTSIVMTFGGDCVLGTRKTYETSPETFNTFILEKGYTWPFRGLVSLFEQDDLTSVNLEGVLQDSEDGYYPKEFSFRGTTDYVNILTQSSIEHVNIANNHIGDYRKAGLESTLAALKGAQVAYSGSRNLYVYEKDGIKIGFGGCRETDYKESKSKVQKDLKELREMGCDAIVYMYHFGREYSPTHNKLQEGMADYAIKRGANIIIGTHPHCLQGVEERNGGLVLYSLGNLVFGGTLDMRTFDAVLARVEMKFENNTYLGANLHLIPVLTSGDSPRNDFSPVLAKTEDYRRIMQLIQDDSPMPITADMWFPVKPSKK